jgi:hypothetical protein
LLAGDGGVGRAGETYRPTGRIQPATVLPASLHRELGVVIYVHHPAGIDADIGAQTEPQQQ